MVSRLKVYPYSQNRIIISWEANKSDIVWIERSEDCINFSKVARAKGLIYSDAGLKPGTRYWYRLRGFPEIAEVVTPDEKKSLIIEPARPQSDIKTPVADVIKLTEETKVVDIATKPIEVIPPPVETIPEVIPAPIVEIVPEIPDEDSICAKIAQVDKEVVLEPVSSPKGFFSRIWNKIVNFIKGVL